MGEDQFFSTLFMGSGYLYLGITITSAAIVSAIMAAYAFAPEIVSGSEGVLLARLIVDQLNTVYSVRMAGMFMMVLGTIWVRTELMPRWLAFITYGVAIILLIGIGFTYWITLAFPGWVLLTSVYIMVGNYRRDKEEKRGDGMAVNNG